MTSLNRFALPAASIALLLSAATRCLGFAEFARGALTLQTSATGTYDSYFVGKTSNGDDYSLTLQPSLNFSRNAGLSKLTAAAGVNVVRYDKNSDEDSEDYFASINLTLPTVPGARLTGGAAVHYTESTEIDLQVNDRVPSRQVGASVNLSHRLGLKMSLSDSFNYNRVLREIYSDQEVWNNAVSFGYSNFLNETSLSLSHSFTRTKSSGDNFLNADLDQTSNSFSAGLSRPLIADVVGNASVGYSFLDRAARETTAKQTSKNGVFFGVGVTGPFLPRKRFPKLTSSLSVNYQESPSVGINDTGGKNLTGGMSLSWNARERTKLRISADRTTTLSASDLTVLNTTVSAGVSEQIGLFTHADASVNYSWSKFRGIQRKDGAFSTSLSLSRPIGKRWSASASYNYMKNNDTSSGFQPGRFVGRDFTRHVVSLSASGTF